MRQPQVSELLLRGAAPAKAPAPPAPPSRLLSLLTGGCAACLPPLCGAATRAARQRDSRERFLAISLARCARFRAAFACRCASVAARAVLPPSRVIVLTRAASDQQRRCGDACRTATPARRRAGDHAARAARICLARCARLDRAAFCAALRRAARCHRGAASRSAGAPRSRGGRARRCRRCRPPARLRASFYVLRAAARASTRACARFCGHIRARNGADGGAAAAPQRRDGHQLRSGTASALHRRLVRRRRWRRWRARAGQLAASRWWGPHRRC